MKHTNDYGGLHSNDPNDCYACWFSQHVQTCAGCEQCVPREWLKDPQSEGDTGRG